MRVIVLPVRSLDESKSRLTPVLSPMERGALTLAMLEDVMDATAVMPGWETWVVSPDDAVLEVAAIRGTRPIPEEQGPLGAALIQAQTEAVAAGAQALTVLLPDTAMITPAALTRALHTLGPVVIGPSADGVGTNLLVRRPCDTIAAHFGNDSFRRHLQAAAEAEVPAAVVESPEVGFDLDLPGDILTVLRSRRRTRTRDVLRELGAEPRFDPAAAANR